MRVINLKMSKAFTSESDDQDDGIGLTPLPSGLRNYVTPVEHSRLIREIERLQAERRQLNGADVVARDRAEKNNRLLFYFQQRLDAAHVINPAEQPRDRVLFGARVALTDAQGGSETWRIVGIDEMDVDKGDIAWTSPLASALLDKKVGDQIRFMNRTLTVRSIEYPTAK